MKNFGPQKTLEAALLGIGEEIEWWDSNSNSGISYPTVAHYFQLITRLPNAGIVIAS